MCIILLMFEIALSGICSRHHDQPVRILVDLVSHVQFSCFGLVTRVKVGMLSSRMMG